MKPKVEDGIFGTSGGIGFTKQNELFVGRVAMIGFAVSPLCFPVTHILLLQGRTFDMKFEFMNRHRC